MIAVMLLGEAGLWPFDPRTWSAARTGATPYSITPWNSSRSLGLGGPSSR